MQTNPTTVIFAASPDHDRAVTPAMPVVERYELRIALAGSAELLTTIDLGKPTPNDRREIRVTPLELIHLPAGVYTVRVAAIGAGGETVSDPAALFARLGTPRPPSAVRLSGGTTDDPVDATSFA